MGFTFDAIGSGSVAEQHNLYEICICNKNLHFKVCTHIHTHTVPTCIQPLQKPPAVCHALLNPFPSILPLCTKSGWSPSLQDLSSRQASHITAWLPHIPPTYLWSPSADGPLREVQIWSWQGGFGEVCWPPK